MKDMKKRQTETEVVPPSPAEGKEVPPAPEPAPRVMPLEEWAREAGLSPIALRAMQLRYRSDRATAEEWMSRYTRMMAEVVRH
ncbi:hypothetical protein Thermus72351_05590 [Thermus brockianus]